MHIFKTVYRIITSYVHTVSRAIILTNEKNPWMKNATMQEEKMSYNGEKRGQEMLSLCTEETVYSLSLLSCLSHTD